jgi:TonB family protein
MRRLLAGLFCVVALPAIAADVYTSSDGRYRAVMIQKEPATDNENFSAEAELYHRRDRIGTWRLVRHWILAEPYVPRTALVANDGTVVAVSGIYLEVGVIYRADGHAVRKIGLADVLEDEDYLQLQLSTRVDSWAGNHRIDDAQRAFVIELIANGKQELPVSLDTGELLIAKRPLFPHPKVTWVASDVKSKHDELVGVSATEFADRVLSAPLPGYPMVARKARIGGTVVLEFTVNENGFVEQIQVLKPLPFGIAEAAQKAIQEWRFRPIEHNKMLGHVTMTFDPAQF